MLTLESRIVNLTSVVNRECFLYKLQASEIPATNIKTKHENVYAFLVKEMLVQKIQKKIK